MASWQQELDALVAEYLSDQRLDKTLSCLREECKERGRRISTGKPRDHVQAKSRQLELLVAFDCGEREAFFQLWDSLVPDQLRASDATCQDLEFSLAVFFAIHPLVFNVAGAPEAMKFFQSYLASRGAMLAQSQERAIYCALPYFPDPSTHPSFQHLFTDTWIQELKARLNQFMQLLPDSAHLVASAANSEPVHLGKGGRLLDVFLGWNTTAPVQAELKEIRTCYSALASVSVELIEILEESVAGKTLDPEHIQDVCTRLLQATSLVASPALAGTSPSAPRPKSSASTILRASVMSLRQSVQVTSTDSWRETWPLLDMSRLKHDLHLLPDRNKALLLQALRWRLTQSSNREQRERFLHLLLSSDILGLQDSGKIPMIMSYVAETADPVLQEQCCRLLNSLSSFSSGRDYLQQNHALVHTLCSLLSASSRDDHLRKNVLGTVQKLSLRRPLQTLMIKENLLHWTVVLLTDAENLSEYTLRYSLALLMNLCLRSAGRRQCIGLRPSPLTVLIDLLEHEDLEIRSYVDGILYSLLDVPALHKAALEMGMEDTLQSAMSESPPELQSQLQYMIVRLQAEPGSPLSDQDSSDEGEEEDEGEDPDVVEGDDGEEFIGQDLRGEELLKMYYEVQTEDNIATQVVPAVPFMRPVTPRTVHSASSANQQAQDGPAMPTTRPTTSAGV